MAQELINSAIENLDINSAIENIDINSAVVKATDEAIRETYANTKYYIRILLITCVILALLCIVFSTVTTWANYTVMTNQRTTREIMQKIEEAERLDRPIHDYTYRSKYNYDSLGEVERLIYEQYNEIMSSDVKTVMLEDIHIENENQPFRMELGSDPGTPSPLMASLVRDSWLSASSPQYILDKFNTNRIIAEFFVERKDLDTLKKILGNRSATNGYQLDVPNSDLVLIIRFNIYKRDSRNRLLHRTSTTNPPHIPIDMVWNPHTIKIRGVGDIRTFRRFGSLYEKAKPYLFYFWQNEKNKKTPVHIKLAHKTIEKHCSKSFRLTKLDDQNIYTYLPELKPYRKRLESFKIAHRVDVYRIYLLYKYGGLYIDSDTVILKDPIDLIAPLDTVSDDENLRIEYVGFGCTGKKCEANGFMRPSNGLMGTRRGSFLMHDIRRNIHNLIFSDAGSLIDPDRLKKADKTYFMIGKRMIWSLLDRFLKSHRYTYLHIDSNLLGIRDKDGYWVTNRRLFDTKRIEYVDEDSMYLIVFYNSEFQDPDLLRDSKESDILDSKMQIARFFKRALK
jgi:hypothetical protein